MPKTILRKETYIGTYDSQFRVEHDGNFLIIPALNVLQATGNYPKDRLRVKITIKVLQRKENMRKPPGYWKKYNKTRKRALYRRKYREGTAGPVARLEKDGHISFTWKPAPEPRVKIILTKRRRRVLLKP